MIAINTHSSRRWPWVLGSMLGGGILAVLVLLAVPVFSTGAGNMPPLPEPSERVRGRVHRDGPKVAGNLFTTIKNFSLEDPQGNTVLSVAEIGAFLDLDAIGGSELVRMPRGHAHDVKLLLRRGPSGRVSLSEAFQGNSEPHEPKQQRGGTPLQIGPLNVKNVKMTVAMGTTPVVIHIDHAIVSVQRKASDLAPRIFLSNIHGHMVSPDPLPQPIAIEGGAGVVDLAGDPLVDIRVRVCIGDSEMRIRIGMPERHEQVQLTVDAHGALANSALVALNMVSIVKPEKLAVESAGVTVEEPFECSRSKGVERRTDMEASAP